jgi:hypothetical protein
MKYSRCRQSKINDFFIILAALNLKLLTSLLSHTQTNIKTKCLITLEIFFILGTDRVIQAVTILTTSGVFQKSLMTAIGRILRELAAWERDFFDVKSLRSGVF